MSALKIVILGAGSVGCYLGGLLVHAGANVTFLGRETYQRMISENGLRVSHFERGSIEINANDIDFQTDPKALASADIVALCTKSQDTAAAAAQIKAHCKADAVVVSFQNGVRNSEVLKAALPPENILAAIVPFNITPVEGGAFHCGTSGPLVIERPDHLGNDIYLMQVKAAFEAAGQEVHLSKNIIGDQWAKMLVNLNNGLNTLAGGTLKEGLLQRDYRRAWALLIGEGLSAAAAHNIAVGTFNGRSPASLIKVLTLPNFAFRILLQVLIKIDEQARSSMLDDLEAGRGSEVEYLQGEIVRSARAVNIDAPYNAAALVAVNAAFAAGRSPKLSGLEILQLLNK